MDDVIDAKTESVRKTREKLKSQKPDSHFDTAWKKVLGLFFQDFMALCLPKYYDEIDWALGYESLDSELLTLSRGAPIGKRVADKLIKVFLENGTETFIILHLEVQGSHDRSMSERMFIYRYKVYDKYKLPVVSIAILIDGSNSWRPNYFRSELWGSYVELKFITIKLLDYRSQIEELKASKNRFALVILAQLEAIKKYPDEIQLVAKTTLTKALYKNGWSKDDILSLYEFLDLIMTLPPALELEYNESIRQMEKEINMTYITTAERIGFSNGFSNGFEEGERNGELALLIRQLTRKFGSIAEHYKFILEQATSKQLLEYGDRVLEAKSIDEIFN